MARSGRAPRGPDRSRLADGGVRISDETACASLDGAWTIPVLRWYQREALERWDAANHRGVVALPTGSGKTVVALAAIAKLAVATLVLVPTRVLLDQMGACARVLAPRDRPPR